MIIRPSDRLDSTGEYYFSRKLREIKGMIADGIDVINIGIGDPDGAPSAETIAALSESAANPEHHKYQPYNGTVEFRRAIADWYGKIYAVELDPENEVLPLLGSKEGIMHISMAFLNAGDQVLVPNPGYPTYTAVSNLLQAEVKSYDLTESGGWFPDLDALESTDLSKVKIMWINYPHMPSGAAPTRSLFQALIRFARKHRILLCHDNPYSLILNDSPRSIFSEDGARDVCLELNSLSKSHNMAGWRIGMVCGAKRYLSSILKVKSNFDSGMFLPTQHAAMAALRNPRAWHERNNRSYLERRTWVNRILEAVGCTFDPNQSGMFVWAKIPETAASAADFSDRLLRESHVFVTPGSVFGSNGSRFVRASLCASRSRLEEALERIQASGESGSEFRSHRRREVRFGIIDLASQKQA